MLSEYQGAGTLGKTLSVAYNRMKKSEDFVHILFTARIPGKEKNLSLMKIKELYNIAESTYCVKIDPRNGVYN